MVLLPYEITLLSNDSKIAETKTIVLLPYEITLLSNTLELAKAYNVVLLPYEITLLSNSNRGIRLAYICFTTL